MTTIEHVEDQIHSPELAEATKALTTEIELLFDRGENIGYRAERAVMIVTPDGSSLKLQQNADIFRSFAVGDFVFQSPIPTHAELTDTDWFEDRLYEKSDQGLNRIAYDVSDNAGEYKYSDLVAFGVEPQAFIDPRDGKNYVPDAEGFYSHWMNFQVWCAFQLKQPTAEIVTTMWYERYKNDTESLSAPDEVVGISVINYTPINEAAQQNQDNEGYSLRLDTVDDVGNRYSVGLAIQPDGVRYLQVMNGDEDAVTKEDIKPATPAMVRRFAEILRNERLAPPLAA